MQTTSPEKLDQIMSAIEACPLPNPEEELLHDLESEPDVLLAEADMLQAGIAEAAELIGRGENVALNARVVLHALRRQRAILRAVRVRTQNPS